MLPYVLTMITLQQMSELTLWLLDSDGDVIMVDDDPMVDEDDRLEQEQT